MDTKTLIKTLRTLFSNENKIEKKYVKVWMNRVVIEGFYDTKRYELHVQYDQPIPLWTERIGELVDLLHEKAKEVYTRLYTVKVHHFEDNYYHCEGSDILIYEEEDE